MATPDLPQWLQAARQLFEAAFGPASGPVRIKVQAGEGDKLRELAYTVPIDADHGHEPLPALSTFERDVIHALGPRCMTAKQLAAKLGRRPDPAFRTLMANFVNRNPPVIESTPQGYRVVRTHCDGADTV